MNVVLKKMSKILVYFSEIHTHTYLRRFVLDIFFRSKWLQANLVKSQRPQATLCLIKI